MADEKIEQLAGDFLQLMPQFRRNVFKSFERVAKSKLSPLQFHILFFLKDKEALSMSELAGELDILKQQLTFLTDKLAENNFIERVPDKEDRRSVKISITQAGIDFLKNHQKQILDQLVSKFEHLSTEDINELHGAIQSINKIMNRL